jgi:hypothetical protein
MDGRRRSGPTPAPPGDAPAAWRPAQGYLALALVIAVGVPLAWLLAPGSAPPETAAAPPTPIQAAATVRTAPVATVPEPVPTPAAATPLRTAVSSTPAPAASPAIARTRDPNGDQTVDLSDYVNPGETPTMAEVIDRLHAAGVTSGLGAFSPPGTRPPKVGLAVPEDFELPYGYVRHYQATDDGQRIEPILMFSPDVPWHDGAGRPIALPADRVVPPELAPPGLPLQRIVIPAPAGPGK